MAFARPMSSVVAFVSNRSTGGTWFTFIALCLCLSMLIVGLYRVDK